MASSSYTPPSNHAEYMQRLTENSQIGRYLDTAMHMPCPFCAAPDFLVYKILETKQILAEGAVCKECGRGCKAIFTQEPTAPGCSFEFVQTCGPDQPDWLAEKSPMRRAQ